MATILSVMPVTAWMGARDHAAEAALLKKLRSELGWNQEDTARRVGVRMRAYARWESGKGRCQLAALELLERIVQERKKAS